MPSDLTARLAGVPGAEDLVGLATRLERADPAAVRGAGREFAVAAERVGGCARVVARAGTGVSGGWVGAGAEAFTRYAADFARAGRGTEQAVRGVGTEVEAIARTLQGLRDELRTAVSRALDAAERAQRIAATRLPSTGGAVVSPDELVRTAVAGPTADARAAAARAEAELVAAAGRLRALVGSLAGFSRLPVPDTAVLAPSGAGPVGWSPKGEEMGPTESSTPEPTRPTEPRPKPETTPPAPTGGPAGTVGDWIREATGILAANGVDADKMDPDAIATIIQRESGGDPDAVNNWDSNADKGTPSQGLMQTIGPTFAAHRLPGHGDIRDPIDNIIAGVRYAIDRYGSVSDVPGIRALGRGDGYVGY